MGGNQRRAVGELPVIIAEESIGLRASVASAHGRAAPLRSIARLCQDGSSQSGEPEVKAVDRSQLRPIFDWGRCQSCMVTSEGWDALVPAPGSCPNCGERGYGAEWPPEPARLLLRHAFLREADDQEEAAARAYLVATALDVMLAWVLRMAVDYLSTDSHDVARLIDRVREPGLSPKERLELLDYVADADLGQVSRLKEVPDFPSQWKDLRERRDRFLHEQQQSAFEGLTEADLADTARAAVAVMAHINNMVW